MSKSILHSFVLVVLLDTALLTTSTIRNEDYENRQFDVNVGIKDCGKKDGLGCLGFSDGCIEVNDCIILATYQARESGDVTFTISGIVETNQYLAYTLDLLQYIEFHSVY